MLSRLIRTSGTADLPAKAGAAERGRLVERAWPPVVALVAAASLLNGLLAVPVRRPRIFGDELIYWELARGFAWTGHFTVRGGAAPRYGVVYPALLSTAQRIGNNRPKQAHRDRIRYAACYLTSKPTLPFARIIVRKHMRRAGVPASAEAFTQLQAHTRMPHILRTYPAFMPCSATIQNRLPMRALPTGVRRGFPVVRPVVSSSAYPGWHNADRKEELDGRIQHVFLQRVHNLMFDFCHDGTSVVYARHCTNLG